MEGVEATQAKMLDKSRMLKQMKGKAYASHGENLFGGKTKKVIDG
ncbi:hypothetical protein D881_05365 [Corynebacterium ulcerans NCTC 12077]|nr:hypothetical protein D881_05365 [Corynebacterium ulcerans NCTC 12077]